MNAIAAFLDGPFADALGRALVHLVWQASLIALLLAGTLAAMRRSSANARYAASCAALALTVILPVATAFVSFETQAPATVSPATTFATPVPVAVVPPVAHDPSARETVAAFPLDPALPWVVGFWLLGVTLLSARIGLALASAHRLAGSGIDTLPREWSAALRRLTDAMGVGRAVRLLESTRVDVPTVVGWLEPVILVPASALTGLTPQQLETVLAHELAHIRRHDFLVNLAQTVVETLFFYHPAVWWISSRVRVEREHCCDDAAVAICGDAIGYARALTTLEEMRAARIPSAALASTGGSLLGRVRRLVGLSNDDLGSTRPIAALIALSIVTAAIAIPLSARVGRAGNASGTTITVDAARSQDEVTGIWVAGSTPEAEDDLYDSIFEASELAAAELEVRRAEIERQIAAIESERDGIDDAIAEALSASAISEAQIAAIESERDRIDEAIAGAMSASAISEAQIAAILAVAPPAPPTPTARPAQPAPPAPPAEGGWAWPAPRPAPVVAPVAPAPAVRPVTPVPPVAPVAPAPWPAVASFAGSGKPVDPDNPSVDDLVLLHSAGVDASYIRALQKAGLRDLTARQLVLLESAGVDDGYVRSMEKSIGRKLSWSQLLRLRALDVDEGDVEERRARGEKVDVDSLLQLRNLRIDREELDRMRSELDRSRALADEARRLAYGVDAGYKAELAAAGLKELSAREYLMLKSTGVDGDWVKEMRAAGYGNFSPSELAALRATGVDGDYLREMAAAGFTKLDASQLMRLRAAGIDAEDLREWKK